MATHATKRPNFAYKGGSISKLLEDLPEGATQTFTWGAPIVITGGYVVEAADPVTALWGFAMGDASNDAAAGTSQIKVLPVVSGLEIILNFLASGGGNNTLAAADLGGNYDFKKTAGGIWYAADAAAAASLRMVSFNTDSEQAVPNKAAAGDVNARVHFVPLATIISRD